MASPPRRMTRARAKKEGYEPDWRINPHWKTPRKPKTKSTRFVLPESTEKGTNAINQGSVGEPGQRPRLQIRIAAKLPSNPLTVERASAVTATGSGESPNLDTPLRSSPGKSVNLGSPVRVRPRSEIVYTAADKENSPSAALLATWASTGKSTIIPKTPVQPSRSRPLEASPSIINTQPRGTVVKVLTTPVRIPNPQTPGRNLGTARRIPVKVEKTKPTSYKLDPANNTICPGSHRDFSYRVNPQSATLTKTARSIQVPTSPHKMQHSGLRAKLPPKLDVLRFEDMERSDSIEAQSPQLKAWIPLKAGPTFQRPTHDLSAVSTRPAKGHTLNHIPDIPVTKLDFYVDEASSVPLQDKPKSVQPASTPVLKFPIRSQSISRSSSASVKTPSTPRITSNPIHFDSLEELRPIAKAEKWRTPKKGPFNTPLQSVHKVCFRTPGTESPEDDGKILHTLGKSFSILRLATPELAPTSDVSTTPLDPPHSPSSPKIFDLSDPDDSFQLFTPRKTKSSSIPRIAHSVQPPPAVKPEQDAGIRTPVTRNVQLDTDSPAEVNLAVVTSIKPLPESHLPTPLNIQKGTPRPSGDKRDFSIPLKPAHLETPLRPSKPQSTTSSTKPHRGERDATGPLNGVIAFVDVKTADGDDASAPFADSLKTLGAKVVKQWGWNGEELDKVGITHVIFKQGGPRTLSKVKMAKGLVKCVGLGWISRSVSLGTAPN